MNLFGTKDATPTTTGEDVLREALRVRFKRGPVSVNIHARELGVGVGTLEDFANGRTKTLPAATLNAAAKFIFGDNASFDAERNLLVRTPRPAAPAQAAPPPSAPRKPPPEPYVPPRSTTPYVPPKTPAGWATD